MKPNEVIGSIGMLGIVGIFWVSSEIGFNIWSLIGIGICGLLTNAFLSLWAMWTFNPWFYKKFPSLLK